MFLRNPPLPEGFILATHFKRGASGCRNSSCLRIIGRALKAIGGVIPEMVFHRPKSFGPISSLQAFLLALLLPGIACHAETPMIGTITPAELARRLKMPNPPIILDVRTREEYAAGHIDAALNLPHGELGRRLGEIPGDKSSEIVVYCRSGKRARIAEGILVEKGYKNVKDLAGHWQGWDVQTK